MMRKVYVNRKCFVFYPIDSDSHLQRKCVNQSEAVVTQYVVRKTHMSEPAFRSEARVRVSFPLIVHIFLDEQCKLFLVF